MRRKLVAAVVAVVALLVGVGIGAAGKTKTVMHTGTVAVANTRTVVRTQRVVPKGCAQAIADARRIDRDAASGFSVSSKWPTLVSQAAVAGANQDAAKIESLAAELRAGTARLNALVVAVVREGLAFNAAAARCR